MQIVCEPFDELFFVDLPDSQEREQIWNIVIARHGRNPGDYDSAELATTCEQFTGAEIEAVFIDSLHEAFAEGREPVANDINEAMANTVPLAQLMDGQITALRTWAKGRARPAAGKPGGQEFNGKPAKQTPATSRPNRRIAGLN